MVCKYFFSVCSLHFCSLNDVILRARVFPFNEVRFTGILFHAFSVVFGPPCLAPSHREVPIYLLVKSLIVLCIIFRSVTFFELIFVEDVKFCRRRVSGVSILIHWSMSPPLSQCHSVLMSAALWYILKLSSIIPSTLIFSSYF